MKEIRPYNEDSEKKRRPNAGECHAKTTLYDQMAEEIRDNSGLSKKDMLSDRSKMWREVRIAQRFAKIVEIGGWAGVAFINWDKDWMWQANEDVFERCLNNLKSKRGWIRKTAAKHFGSDALELLCSTNSSTGLKASTKKEHEFDLVSKLKSFGLDKHNAERIANALQGFAWEDYSCSLDVLLLNITCLVEALGKDGYYGRGKGQEMAWI